MLRFLTFFLWPFLLLFYFLLSTLSGKRHFYPFSFFWIFVFLFAFFLSSLLLKSKKREAKLKLNFFSLAAGLLGGVSLPLFYFRQGAYIPPQSDLLFLLLLVPPFTFILTFSFNKFLSLRFKNQLQPKTGATDFSYISLLLAHLFGLFSAISVLSNLERPSSFAPLVKFFNLEIFPLASSGLLAISLSYLVLSSKFLKKELKVDFNWLFGFVLGGFFFSLFWLISCNQSFLAELSSFSLPLIISFVLVVFFRFLKAWRFDLKDFFLKLHFIYFSPLLMVLIFVPLERLKETFLFSPLVIKGVVGGAALFFLSLIASTIEPHGFSRCRFGLIFSGMAMFILALIVLASPYCLYNVSGRPGSAINFSKSWASPGYEFIVPWLFLLTALFLLCLARSKKADLLKGFFFLVCSSIFLPWLARTRLWNWFAFLPPEVSEAVGTEYLNWQEKLLSGFYYHLSFNIIILAAFVALTYFWLEFFKGKRRKNYE